MLNSYRKSISERLILSRYNYKLDLGYRGVLLKICRCRKVKLSILNQLDESRSMVWSNRKL
ncbi:MAG: hypothetical protein QXH21_08765 [Ignisphaera sp.]